MKVLVVIDSFGLGGAENLLAVLARAAPEAGLDLHVASLAPRSMGRLALQPVLEQAGLKTSFLDVPRLAHPSAAWRVAQAIRASGADVVHAHLEYSAILAPPAARMLGRGSVATLHHVPGDEVGRERFKERMALAIPGRLGTLVFVSDASRAGFARMAPERPSWRTVHNGVDVQRFSPGPAAPLAGLDLPPDAQLVTIVAALRQPKGHAVALEAWERVAARVPHAHLLVVGEGEERARLEADTSRRGLAGRVTFAGMRHDIPELLRASTLVALPSFTEALPTVLIEAAACGRATVATDVGGTSEAVRGGETGLLVPPRDADAFAAALTILLEDDGRRAAMGAAGRDWAVREFDAVRWAQRLRKIYEQTPSRASGRTLARLGQ